MLTEEHKILQTTIREYVQKNIDPAALDIERGGIGEDTRKSVSAQGFQGAVVSSSLGGSELDETGYTILLDEIARSSPSVSADILLLNSVFYPLAGLTEGGKKAVKEVLSGGRGATVALNDILEGYTSEGEITGGPMALKGSRANVLGSNVDKAILLTGSDSLVLVNDQAAFSRQDYSFGFRGLGFSTIRMDGTKGEVILEEGGKKKLAEVLAGADLAVSAVALGMVSGCLQKGIDYSQVRKTFGQSLSDYQPVAFTLAGLKAEETLLRKALYSGNLDAPEKLMLKVKSLELAKRASKYALQVHGGYGYFEDFGVEKFYRDSTALSALFGQSVGDMERLAEAVYGKKTGFL